MRTRRRTVVGGSARGLWRSVGHRGARHRLLLFAIVILSVLQAAVASAADNSPRFYRFINEDGQVEIGNAVPAERVRAGYQVLDPTTGQVIETVAPELSPAERAAKAAREQAWADCQKALARVRALYGSLADIDAAEVLAQQGLDARIGHLEAARALEERRLEDQTRAVARLQRADATVTPEILAAMDRSRAQIEAAAAEIDLRREEHRKAEQRFAQDRALFLQGICDLAAEGASP